MSVALLLGLVHAATDFVTITAMVRATGLHAPTPGAVFAWFLAYDVLAFVGQPLIGLIVDRLRPAPVLLVGLAATAGGLALAASGGYPTAALGLPAVVLAGIGNAVTHVGAGAVVLRGDLTRAAPAGLLVAPGAVGLGLGLWYAGDPGLGPTWWAVVPLVAAAAMVVHLDRTGSLDRARSHPSPRSGERLLPAPVPGLASVAVVLLLTSVAIRSLVGASAGRGYPTGPWLTVGIPVVACAGKALGGIVADRLGWLRATVGALVVSVPLLTVRHDHAGVLLVGLLVFQMTMPVTLVTVGRLLPGRPATAFGLPCAALLVGSLPASFAWGTALCTRPLLGAWVVLSALVAWGGLRGGGLRWRRCPPVGPVAAPAQAEVVR